MSLLKKITIFLISINSATPHALGADSVLLQQGQPAPFSGLLLTNERADRARMAEEQNVQYILIQDSLNTTVKLYKEREEIREKQVNVLLEQNVVLSSSSRLTDWEKIGYISIGILATVAAGYGIRQATK